jgi:hypothetical protein
MVMPEWERGPGALLSELDDSDEIVFFEEFGSSDERRHLKDPYSIHQYLNNLENDRRTGTLKLCSSHKAELIFACGKIMRAACGNLQGEAALRHVYMLPNAASLFTSACEVGGAQMNISPCVYLRALRKAATRRIAPERGASSVLRKIFAEEV